MQVLITIARRVNTPVSPVRSLVSIPTDCRKDAGACIRVSTSAWRANQRQHRSWGCRPLERLEGPAGDAVVAGGLGYRERERDPPRPTGTSLVSCIDTRYAVEVTVSFRHKGLERLYRGGSERGVRAAHVPKLLRILSLLDVAQSPDDLAIPSF